MFGNRNVICSVMKSFAGFTVEWPRVRQRGRWCCQRSLCGSQGCWEYSHEIHLKWTWFTGLMEIWHTHTQLELRGYLHCWRLILYMRTLMKHFSFYSLCFIILVTSMLVGTSMICCIHVKETTIRTIPYKCRVLVLIQLLFTDYSFALFFSKTSVLQCLFTTGYLIYRRKVLSVFFDFIALYHRHYNICLVGCSDRLLLMLSRKTHLQKEV